MLAPAAKETLTELEQAILEQLAQGCSFPQVDSALQLDSGIAWRARKLLFRKIGVRSRYQAAATQLPTREIKQADLRCLSHHYHLKEREEQIVMLILNRPDLSRQEIGAALTIADATIRHHMSNLNKKLGVKTRAEAVYTIHTALDQVKMHYGGSYDDIILKHILMRSDMC
jgi:ATP/maltotriose-dependent transcriptional regulator MalT